MNEPATPTPAPALFPREKQILELRARGLSCKEIAYRFGTDYQTVRNQLYLLRQRFGATDTVALMYLVVKAGLID